MNLIKSPRFGIGVTIALILIILVLFLLFVDLEEVGRQIADSDLRFLAAAWVAFIAGLVLYAVRWRGLLADKPQIVPTFHASNVGHMFNLLLPMRAGEPVRIVTIAREPNLTIPEALSSVIVEKQIENFMRVWALGGALTFGLGFDISPLTVLGSLVFLAVIAGGLYWMVNNREKVLSRWPRLLARLPKLSEANAKRILADFIEGLSSLTDLRRLLFAFLWSFLTWGCLWVYQFLSLQALGTELSLTKQAAIALAVMALATPTAPTQPGIYHASVVAPLAAIGQDSTILTAYAVILHVQQMIWMTALGVIGIIHSKMYRDVGQIIAGGANRVTPRKSDRR